MEYIGRGLGQNARMVCVMEVKLQGVPCFASFWCFGAQECLRDVWLVFLAHRDVQNLFGMLAIVEYIRCSSYVLLASWLVLKEKCEVI